MKKKVTTNIKKPIQPMTVIFEPVAQNTVIRPMAQAVCMARAGKTVYYTDTADHKEKCVSLSDLHFLTLHGYIDGKQLLMDGELVATMAKDASVRIRVDVNDVQVFVSKKTTVKQAMDDFYKKITSQDTPVSPQKSGSRQRG